MDPMLTLKKEQNGFGNKKFKRILYFDKFLQILVRLFERQNIVLLGILERTVFRSKRYGAKMIST